MTRLSFKGGSWAVRLVVAAAVFGSGLIWWWVFSLGLPLSEKVVNTAGAFQLAPQNPIPRTEAGGAACEGAIYVVGGIGPRAQTLVSATAYDPSTRTWKSLPDLPEPISHAGVVCAMGRLYVVGGFGPIGIRLRGFMFARWDPLDSVWIYDPRAARWSSGPKMPGGRGAGGIAVARGAIWYVGGIAEDREVSADLFRLDLATNSWERKAGMSTARDHLRMEAVGERLFAISGRKDDLRFNLSAVERYEIETGAWTRAADFPNPRGGLASAVLGGRIYTFGGEHVWTCSDQIERYDPDRDVWESVGTLPEARHGIVAGVIDGDFHLVSGGRRPRISVSGIHRVFEPRLP